MLVGNRMVPNPQSIRFESPAEIHTALNGEPLIGWAWELRLRYALNAQPGVLQFWQDLLGQEVELVVPDVSGCGVRIMGYVQKVGYDIDPDTYTVKGFDVTITPAFRIE